MDDAQQANLTAALDRMWDQFLPQMRERVAVLEAAAAAFASDRLSLAQHQAANAAAHKLAGVLGTFNLTRGTVLARELEMMYSRDGGPDPALAKKLVEIAAELRAIVENRK
jgi:HPt (histidine-containing phosphotransfer) domain-containing protein